MLYVCLDPYAIDNNVESWTIELGLGKDPKGSNSKFCQDKHDPTNVQTVKLVKRKRNPLT